METTHTTRSATPAEARAGTGVEDQGSRVPIALTEGESRLIRDANGAFCELVGRSAAALRGAPLDIVLGGDPRLRLFLDGVCETGAITSGTELPIEAAGRGVVCATALVTPLLD